VLVDKTSAVTAALQDRGEFHRGETSTIKSLPGAGKRFVNFRRPGRICRPEGWIWTISDTKVRDGLHADVDRFRSASISPKGRRGQSRNLRDFGQYLRDFGHSFGRSHEVAKPANCNSNTLRPDRELRNVPGCGTSDLA
jgi:hypothetical protein